MNRLTRKGGNRVAKAPRKGKSLEEPQRKTATLRKCMVLSDRCLQGRGWGGKQTALLGRGGIHPKCSQDGAGIEGGPGARKRKVGGVGKHHGKISLKTVLEPARSKGGKFHRLGKREKKTVWFLRKTRLMADWGKKMEGKRKHYIVENKKAKWDLWLPHNRVIFKLMCAGTARERKKKTESPKKRNRQSRIKKSDRQSLTD